MQKRQKGWGKTKQNEAIGLRTGNRSLRALVQSTWIANKGERIGRMISGIKAKGAHEKC